MLLNLSLWGLILSHAGVESLELPHNVQIRIELGLELSISLGGLTDDRSTPKSKSVTKYDIYD